MLTLADLVAISAIHLPWSDTVLGVEDASQGLLRLHFLTPGTSMHVRQQALYILQDYFPMTVRIDVSCRGDEPTPNRSKEP